MTVHVEQFVETLEESGINPDEYRLHDSVDFEALERLIASTDDPIKIRLTVEGVRLLIEKNGESGPISVSRIDGHN
ncbi:hypothetical protein [Salinarchaeum laminariae]|uniref:hypothetical protein n=1 Tax=Salinarchaeum laminariae TaxID=869888 RepID=UPI0020BE382C|nr:hypothetical protein [Salinarchaeum laminariae]